MAPRNKAQHAVRKVVKTIANAVLKPAQPAVFPKDYENTSQLPVSPLLVDQIIGQDRAVTIIKKATAQKRNVLLVGTPGTGKSMLAQAMSELLPVQELEDIIVAFNPEDDNVPKIKVVKAGDGKKIQQAERMKAKAMGGNMNLVLSLFLMASTAIIIFVLPGTGMPINLVAAMLVGMFILGAAILFASQVGRQRMTDPGDSLKVLIDNSNKKKAPFVDATGSKAGALLGDVRHDPFQCIPAGQRVHLPCGKPVEISTIVDPLLAGEGERELGEAERFDVLGGSDSDFFYSPANVVRVYKRKFSGDLVRLTTKRGQVITVTPNHPIAGIGADGKVAYTEAGKVTEKFLSITNGPDLALLRNAVEGTYAYDEVERVERVYYSGYVYNLTTTTQNYLVNCVLTHNSGGLGTPAHLRVEAGFIHKANKGILFIDEASTLRPKAQQELLTAMQEKKYGITGQSEMSSGALVKTEPVPCDFILVAAGNYQDVAKMHPALRSRIRGYGYEVYMEESIEDNEVNRNKFAVFVAQEVTKDGKIPHFTREAVEEILLEARRRAGRKNKLTLRMRELGGLVRAAGDLAREAGAKLVEKQHVLDAKKLARTLEQQVTQFEIEVRKEYRVFQNEGKAVGRVNGLAVMGDAGIALPIVAEIAPAGSKNEGKIIATGKLGKIAEEAVKNVSAILKKHLGKDTSNFDIHIQFLQTYEGVEGDSASVSVATAVISALEDAPVRQDVAMTGSLSVRGDVLPVGGVTYKAEAALDAGIKTIIVPKANAGDIVLGKERAAGLKIIPVSSIYEVLSVALAESPKKAEILSKVKKELQ